MLMSNQNNLKQQIDTVLNLQTFKCGGKWCHSTNDGVFKRTDQQEYTLQSHVCNYSLSFYVFLRHLFEGETNYSQIDEYITTTHNFSNSPHLLIFFTDGSFCIYGTHLKGLISPTQDPFFSGLLLALLERLSESDKYPNAKNLWELLTLSQKSHQPFIEKSFIDSVKKSLSQKHLIKNNDLKTLQLPPHEDQLLVLFYSIFNNTYKTLNGQYISFINQDMVFFEQGNTLSFRNSDYLYFIRGVFWLLLEAIGSIEPALDDDSDFLEMENSDF